MADNRSRWPSDAWFGRWSRAEVLLLLILLIVVANIALSIIVLVAPAVRRRIRKFTLDRDS